MYVVISVEHNDAAFFLFTCIVTPLPVNNQGGRDCVYAKDTLNRTIKTRKCTYGDKKKTKVDERETKEIKTKQKRKRGKRSVKE
jgi:hypothetical protein